MESRGEETTSNAPLVSFRDQKAVLKPGVVPAVVNSFVKDFLAFQNRLKINDNKQKY